MMLQYLIGLAFVSVSIRTDNGGAVHCYSLLPRSSSSSLSLASSRSTGGGGWRRPSMLQLRRVVRSWERPTTTTTTSSGGGGTRLSLSGSFYDDFEDFGELGSNSDSGGGGDDDEQDDKEIAKPESPGGGDNAISGAGSTDNDDAVMRELRKRMNDLSNQREDEDDEDDDDDDDDDEDYGDADSGSALPDLEGNTLSSIDDLIGFAQAKAREKAKEESSKDGGTAAAGGAAGVGGTWEDENWARPVELDEDDASSSGRGGTTDFEDLLEGGLVLIANPVKFCTDLSEADRVDKKGKGNSFFGGLFDDPFPTSQYKSTSSISPALLAKFGITLPPSPDLGPDRRADLLPVVLLVDRDDVKGCQAVLMNRRTGNLMGDLPPSLFQTADPMAAGDDGGGEDDGSDNGSAGFSPHPLSAFMIQPLWWAGSSPNGNGGIGDEGQPSGRDGVRAISMVHACPYVNGSVPLAISDGLYWGGNPVQAQEAMKDDRLEKPLSGFDFKFFIQTTRWLPSQLEQEIEDGVWYLATVSKEVLFRSRDRLGAKRAKPLWTEIIELLGDDYKHIRDQLYGEEDE
mmetsp:Transcript_1270/g.3160  ORF Transcript_1270/g.3160 Transcript_1270/m.3160 type:complete len:570 (+) Transcript_1270:58-1767(+)